MNKTLRIDLYQRLLEANIDSFVGGEFKVAYHALSGALYCALGLCDQDKIAEIKIIANVQLQELQEHFPKQDFAREALAVTLYRSLLRIAEPRHLLSPIESGAAL